MPDAPEPSPGLKGKNTKTWFIIGGIGVAVIVFYMWSMKKSSGSSSQSTDPNIDPATGVPYSAEYSTGGGYSNPYGASSSLSGYYDPGTGAFISGSGSTVTSPATNASWAQQVEAYLVTNAGYSATDVAAAIGKALTGQPLNTDQAAIVAAAKGFFGEPPQGMPPQLVTGTTGQSSTNATPISPYTVSGQMSFGEWDNNAEGLAKTVYGLNNAGTQDATLGAAQIIAANPQINWAQPIPVGTIVNIPSRFIANEFRARTTAYNQGWSGQH